LSKYQFTLEFSSSLSDIEAEILADRIIGKALYTNNVKSDFKKIVDYKIEKI
jgi:hypothetical protein